MRTHIAIFLKSELLHHCITEKSDGRERLECSLHKDHLTADSRSYVRVWRPDPSKAGGVSTAGGPAAEPSQSKPARPVATSVCAVCLVCVMCLVSGQRQESCRASQCRPRGERREMSGETRETCRGDSRQRARTLVVALWPASALEGRPLDRCLKLRRRWLLALALLYALL